jgi:internalin A
VNLQKLSLCRNQLSELPDSFSQLVNLQYLYLGDNRLSELLDSFVHLVNIIIIDL